MRILAPCIFALLAAGTSAAAPQGSPFGGGARPPAVKPPEEPTQPDAPPQLPPREPTGREGGAEPMPPTGATPPSTTPPTAPTPPAPQQPDTPADPPVPVQKKWLAKMDQADRAALDAVIGWEIAPAAESVEWTGEGVPNAWQDRVVVIQSFSSRRASDKGALTKTRNALKDLGTDVILVALHTPDGADRFTEANSRKPMEGTVAIDAKGSWCDALGVFETPVNLLVGRDGNVRYAGLTADGVKAAAKALVDETLSEDAHPRHRPAPEPADSADFPPCSPPSSQANLLGRPSPDFFVQEWITTRPDMAGKVVVMDFWATWCPPCRAAIPHMNELQSAFQGSAVCIGVSDESGRNFEEGLRKYNLAERDFHYSLALDASGRMKSAFGVRGIPSVAVVSPDGIVRWQGHPTQLNDATLRAIVQASAAGGGAAGGAAGGPPSRWAKRGSDDGSSRSRGSRKSQY